MSHFIYQTATAKLRDHKLSFHVDKAEVCSGCNQKAYCSSKIEKSNDSNQASQQTVVWRESDVLPSMESCVDDEHKYHLIIEEADKVTLAFDASAFIFLVFIIYLMPIIITFALTMFAFLYLSVTSDLLICVVFFLSFGLSSWLVRCLPKSKYKMHLIVNPLHS